MILDKLFKKNKSKEYFLEIDTNATKKPEAEAKTEITETATVKEEKTEVAKIESTQTQSETQPEVKTEQSSTPAAPVVSYDLPEWVKAIKNYSQPKSIDLTNSAPGNNFAGKYVTNNVPTSRRRPGPSLNLFKDMASKISK